jgi:hypothetical protein
MLPTAGLLVQHLAMVSSQDDSSPARSKKPYQWLEDLIRP